MKAKSVIASQLFKMASYTVQGGSKVLLPPSKGPYHGYRVMQGVMHHVQRDKTYIHTSKGGGLFKDPEGQYDNHHFRDTK